MNAGPGRRRLVASLALIAALAGCDDLRAGQLMRTANALGAQGKWAEALHYYERLWVELPEHAAVDEARLRAARIYAGPERNLASATDQYQYLVLKAHDQDARVRALQEMIRLYRDSDGERALELMEIHLRRYPDRPDSVQVRLELANLYLDAQRLSQAVDAAVPLLNHADPAVAARANMLTGLAKELASQPAAALTDFERAIDVAKPGEDPWLGAMAGKARVLDQLDRREEALATARALKSRHPNPEAIEHWVAALETRHAEMNR